MARVLKKILTLCLALGLTSIALGQQQDRQQPQQPSVLGPFANPDVQKELKLSEEQISKLKDAINKFLEKHRDDFAKLQKMSPDEQQKKMMAINEEHNKAVAGVLDAKQWKRYKQFQWQMDPIGSLQDPDLQKELRLSDEQKKKIDSVFKDANKKVQEMMKSGERSPEKLQAVLKDVEKKANDVLTGEQQKNLKELKGPPFQFSRQASPPPRER
jgi:exonuclease VII large subunit